MSKTRKPIHKFHCSHTGLRKFLRLVSYGCYHRKLFEKHEITPRSYDDFLRQIKFFVPEKNLQVTWHDKCAYFTIVGDFRHGTKNYFYSSFLLKTLLPEHCLHKIILLQILADGELLQMSEILKRAEIISEAHKETGNLDLMQTFRRRLNELATSGPVRRVESDKKVFFGRVPNPLAELSADEVKILSVALQFLRNVSFIGTAGYFLCDSLKDFCDTSEEAAEIFQFRNNNFVRILDDNILLKATEAQRRRQKIVIRREGNLTLKVTPIAVETDFLYNRQYLVVREREHLMRLRVDKILTVDMTKEEAEDYSAWRDVLREVRLRVRFENSAERRQREKLLADELPIKIIEESANEFICAVETIDPLQIYPRLWKFQTWAEILPGADGLRERMLHDAEEALKNYAEPV